jgi:hypothetical protein
VTSTHSAAARRDSHALSSGAADARRDADAYRATQDLALTNCVFCCAEDAATLPPYVEMAG